MKGYANPHLLVTPHELSRARSPPTAARPLVLDLRPPDAYAAGHVPGAIHLDLWGVSLIDTDPAPLKAFMWMIEHVLAVHGVDRRTPRLSSTTSSPACAPRAPSGSSSTSAIRRCASSTAGSTRGSRAGLPVTPRRDAARAKERLDGHRARRTRSPRGATSAPRSASRTRSSSTRAATASTRSERRPRADAAAPIPGAVHIEWTRNLTPDGDFKPAAELRKMYEDAGVTPDREVITYCQGGYRAAHSYLALRLLGYPRVRNYVGSWKEWGDREDSAGRRLPISTRH